jgi:molybdopterin-guanine dinucleotide biosynthesis protein A
VEGEQLRGFCRTVLIIAGESDDAATAAMCRTPNRAASRSPLRALPAVMVTGGTPSSAALAGDLVFRTLT